MNYHSFSEAKFAENFTKFLMQKGYPEESLISQPTLFTGDKRRFRPDFAIVDPERQERLAIIEVKGRLEGGLRQSATAQLQSYANALTSETVDLFLVTPVSERDDISSFGFYKLSENGELKEFSIDEFPHFRSLVANKIATRKETLNSKTQETTDSFKSICFSLAAAAVVACIADFVLQSCDIVLLSPERLAVLGVTVALMILPFAAKFKGLGIEYERYTEVEKRRREVK